MILAAGIDVSARRGLHVALLADSRTLLAVAHLPDATAAADWLTIHAPDAPVGIDAPLGPRLPLLTDAATRAAMVPPPAEGRYLSPLADEPAPSWIAAGYALAAALRATGRRAPRHVHDYTATLLEVYPYAAFVTLLGAIPPCKSTSAGRAARLRALTNAGLTGLDAAQSHDALDAVAAAYTAAVFAAGGGCAVGDPTEGLMVLPVAEAAIRDRYARSAERTL